MATMLPPNATEPERTLDATVARISDVGVPNADLWNPKTCPVALLPWLAWALSVDYWNPVWPDATKRKVIAASFDVHRVKGTIGALERALESLQFDAVDVSEWFDFDGDPYTFRVDVELSSRGLTTSEAADIAAVIGRAKNVRSWLDRLRIWLTNKSTVPAIGAVTNSGAEVTIHPLLVAEIDVAGPAPIWAAATYADHVVAIYPQ